MTKYKIVHVIAAGLAFVLLLLPFGVHHVSVAPSETSGVLHETIETYSYFHLDPLKDGNFTPFFTALIAFGLAVLTAISFAIGEKRGMHIAMLVLSAVGMTTAMLPLAFYGGDGFSAVGLTIAFLLLCSLALSVHRMTGRLFCDIDIEED